MNTRMIEETLVRDHMIHMIALFNEMRILRAKVNKKTQVDMILETLLDSFKQFKLNYTINKLMMNLSELMKEPSMVEGILKDPKGVHMAVKDSSGSSSNKKKKNSFNKSKQGKNKVGKENSKGKDKCFIYAKKSHWKKECLDYLKKNDGMSHSLLVELYLVVDSWWIDSNTTSHICNSL